MKKTLIFSLISLSCLALRAQDSARFQTKTMDTPALTAILLQNHSFLGANYGFTRIYHSQKLPIDFGIGFNSGLLFDNIHESQHGELNLGFFSGSTSLGYQEEVRGTVYWLPLEAAVLFGYQQNYIQLGAGIHWLQLHGKRYLEVGDTRYIYRTQVPSFLASLNIGYRYQPSGRGTFFGVFYKPTRNLENEVQENTYQIVLGYSF